MAGVGRDWQIEFRPVHAWIFRGPAAALGYPNCEEGWLDRPESSRRRRNWERSSFTGATTSRRGQRQDRRGNRFGGRPFGLHRRNSRNGSRPYNRNDWLATAWPEHAEGELKPVSGRDSRTSTSSGPSFGGGRFSIVSSYRHIGETDSIAYIDPTSLGIEE
jgi:hypothetical protein